MGIYLDDSGPEKLYIKKKQGHRGYNEPIST
jgi:hypothetical protein